VETPYVITSAPDHQTWVVDGERNPCPVTRVSEWLLTGALVAKEGLQVLLKQENPSGS
jgi:hypothetical protein